MVSVGPAPTGKYLHWDELRWRPPPEGLTLEQWWFGVKLARLGARRATPLIGTDSIPFHYVLADPLLEKLHKIDLVAAGRVEAPAEIVNTETRDRYLVSSLVEEAISSSQLEGAATTRVVAKEMLRSGRAPRDTSERMILNNYRAMELIRDNLHIDLTPEFVFELHRVLTDGTLENPGAAGRIQLPGEERVRVIDERDGTVLHVPPQAEELPERLDLLCTFANEGPETEGSGHPLIKAILLHFWLAYDHPFFDGNGRTARALFYWSALRAGYWVLQFVSISRIIQQGPIRYGRAFLHSESDDGDMTYFLQHQLDTIGRSLEDLLIYVEKKARESHAAEQAAHGLPSLNHRQLALLGHALRHSGFWYTYESHANSHDVVRQTARTDLIPLANLGLLDRKKAGRKIVFVAPEDLPTRIEQAVSGHSSAR